MNKEIRLGVYAKCKLTDFEGTLASKTEILGGATQYCVQPARTAKLEPGKMPDGMNIDWQSLEYINDGVSDEAVDTTPDDIGLDCKVTDRITGLKGTTTRRITFLNGCVYYTVQPPGYTNKETGAFVVPDGVFLHRDVLVPDQQVEKAQPAPVKRANPGGPMRRPDQR